MASDKTVHLTADGRARLEDELRELLDNRRPVIVQRVATARAEGDLSENFAYHDARQELGLLDGRVQTIEAMLRNAKVMETTVGDVVGLGSTVTIRDEFGESTYVIVGPVEADVAAGRISMVSPTRSRHRSKAPASASTTNAVLRNSGDTRHGARVQTRSTRPLASHNATSRVNFIRAVCT